MKIEDVKAKTETQYVTDRQTIRCATETLMFDLLCEDMYMPGCTIHGEPMGDVRLNEIAEILGLAGKDDLPATFGSLLRLIMSKEQVDVIALSDIALMSFGYIPKRKQR